MDALLDQTISRDEFNDRKIELNNEELSIRLKLDGIKDGDDDRLETISDTLELLKQLSTQDFSEDGEQILQIAKRASSNFSISGNSLVLTWVSPLDALVNLTDGEECDPYRGMSRTRIDLFVTSLLSIAGIDTNTSPLEPLPNSEVKCTE